MRQEAEPTFLRPLTLAVLRDASVLVGPKLLPHREVSVVRVEALPLAALTVGPILEDHALREDLLHAARAGRLALCVGDVPFADPEIKDV